MSLANPDDPTDPLWGDVVVVHPGSLHGGAPVDERCPNRHTIVFRFFGDDATFRPLPEQGNSYYARNGVLFVEEMAKLNSRNPFRSPVFKQLV